MSWTSPFTAVTGNLILASDWNTSGRDDINYLFGQKVEPGCVVEFAGASAPTGWLVCDGSAISRTTYAALFTNIGITWGAGDGSTTFNLPDLRGRVAVSAGAGSGLTARTLAATGGEETHVLTTAELAAHSHGLTDPGHVHGVTDSGHTHGVSSSPSYASGTFRTFSPSGTQEGFTSASGTTGVTVNSGTTGITSGSAGSGTAHNNMQPFAVLNRIIKT